MHSPIDDPSTLIPLTTAYREPTSCQNNFKTTTTSLPGSSDVVSILVSEPIDSCYPSGWDNSNPENHISFSPAICPSGWTYNMIAEVTHSSTVVTTAFCCARDNDKDYQLARPVVSNQCGKWLEGKPEDDGSGADTDRTIKAPDRTFLVHQAWAVTWGAPDRTTLSPNPHTLSSGQTKPMKRGESDVDPWFTSYYHFLFIGLPIIVVSILFCCFGLCWWNRRKIRKRGQEIPLDSVPPQAGNENWSARS